MPDARVPGMAARLRLAFILALALPHCALHAQMVEGKAPEPSPQASHDTPSWSTTNDPAGTRRTVPTDDAGIMCRDFLDFTRQDALWASGDTRAWSVFVFGGSLGGDGACARVPKNKAVYVEEVSAAEQRRVKSQKPVVTIRRVGEVRVYYAYASSLQ